jgi:hypothetical protein
MLSRWRQNGRFTLIEEPQHPGHVVAECLLKRIPLHQHRLRQTGGDFPFGTRVRAGAPDFDPS